MFLDDVALDKNIWLVGEGKTEFLTKKKTAKNDGNKKKERKKNIEKYAIK